MSKLDEFTARAVALAEMQTQFWEPATVVDSVEGAGHVMKRLALAAGEDGSLAECPKMVDDCDNTVYEKKKKRSSRVCVGWSCGARGYGTVDSVWTSRKNGPKSEQWSAVTNDHVVYKQLHEGFAIERQRSQED